MIYTLINQTKLFEHTIHLTQPAPKVICAGGFLVNNNTFLFGKRSTIKDWAPGLWDIAGGHALKNEDPMFTLQRELFEETGVQVLNATLLTTADVVGDNKNEIIFHYYIYMITHFKGKAYNKTDEHTRLQWFTRTELGELPLALREYLTLIDEWMEMK